jgi:hypothetical protein
VLEVERPLSMIAMITVVLLEEATAWHLHCNVHHEMWAHHRVQHIAADNLHLWRLEG